MASIIEATVSSTYQKYDPDQGPRTFFVLSDIVVHAGAAPDSNEFSHLGGKTPEGEEMVVFDVPTPVQGRRYIMFVSSFPWLYTPIWSGLLFSVQDSSAGSFVVGPHGRVVTGAGKGGVTFGPALPTDTSDAEAMAGISGLTKTDFVTAMADAAAEVGAPLGAAISFKPDPNQSWKFSNTAPAGVE